jgi:hypothetical protein
MGQAFRLGDASFTLHRSDRNTIYRVAGRFNWYLKLPRSGDRQIVAREHLGASLVAGTLGGRSDYGGSSVIRVSMSPTYVLATEIVGQPINRALVTRAWRPWPMASTGLERSFATLGRLLATLHGSARLPADAPEATKRPFATLDKRLQLVRTRDDVIETIVRWFAAHARPDSGDTFVHGNMRLDNVLMVGDRVGFLDFEHCGSGRFYQDLARPVTHLLQVSVIFPFPRWRIVRCLNAYLQAYSAVRRFDVDELNCYVGARLSRYYLETQHKSLLASRIAGFPVLRTRIAGLTTRVLNTGIQGAVPGLSL